VLGRGWHCVVVVRLLISGGSCCSCRAGVRAAFSARVESECNIAVPMYFTMALEVGACLRRDCMLLTCSPERVR
jgi:hypothetical protein